jgi:ankyrin repeat protein
MSTEPHYISDADAIVSAALCGDYDIVTRLAEAGTDVNIRDELGRTALMVAVDETYFGIVEYLLEHGADPNISDNDGDSPLDIARYSSLFRVHGNTEIVDLLIAYGAKGKDGPSAKEKRDEIVYEAFDSINAVRRLISEIEKKKDS